MRRNSERLLGNDSAVDGIARLVQWKMEATEVLGRWESVFHKVPASFTKLGRSKADEVGRYIDFLNVRIAELESRPPNPYYLPWLKTEPGQSVVVKTDEGWVHIGPEPPVPYPDEPPVPFLDDPGDPPVLWRSLTFHDHGRRVTVRMVEPPCGGKGCQGTSGSWTGVLGNMNGRTALYLDGSETIGRLMGSNDTVEFHDLRPDAKQS